jgi:Tfp pilus assembly protein PilV
MQWIRRSGRKRRAASDAGFSLLEVVIAILTITTFLTGTLQLMAINALYKARAERQTRANFWIQEDMEEVKSIAREINAVTNPKACNDTSEGYATALKVKLGNKADDTTQTVASRAFVGKSYTLFRDFPDDAAAQKNRPHRLRINYRVRLADGQRADDYQTQKQEQETTISTGSFEVIPDASFQCP